MDSCCQEVVFKLRTASFADHAQTVFDIWDSATPSAAKAAPTLKGIHGGIPNLDTVGWDATSPEYMATAQLCKFTNPIVWSLLQHVLFLADGRKIFVVEACDDPIWGGGVSLDNLIQDILTSISPKWVTDRSVLGHGQNKLGKLLEQMILLVEGVEHATYCALFQEQPIYILSSPEGDVVAKEDDKIFDEPTLNDGITDYEGKTLEGRQFPVSFFECFFCFSWI